MGSRYIPKRERELKDAFQSRNIEEFFWWIVREHEDNLLDGDPSHMTHGVFRLALDRLSAMHMKRMDAEEGDKMSDSDVAELERVLKVVK